MLIERGGMTVLLSSGAPCEAAIMVFLKPLNALLSPTSTKHIHIIEIDGIPGA